MASPSVPIRIANVCVCGFVCVRVRVCMFRHRYAYECVHSSIWMFVYPLDGLCVRDYVCVFLLTYLLCACVHVLCGWVQVGVGVLISTYQTIRQRFPQSLVSRLVSFNKSFCLTSSWIGSDLLFRATWSDKDVKDSRVFLFFLQFIACNWIPC